jgi:hypothetical protein
MRTQATSSIRADFDPLCGDEVAEALEVIGALHAVALHGTDPPDTRLAYSQVWDTALHVLDGMDAKQYPVEYAQVLMFLYNAASVLNRQDLALGYARHATLVLAEHTANGTSNDYLIRFRINALAAEVLSLNNLGL